MKVKKKIDIYRFRIMDRLQFNLFLIFKELVFTNSSVRKQ